VALLELFAAAVVPCLVLLWFIVRKDRYEREPFRMLLSTFTFGALSIIPALILEVGLSSFVPEPENPLSDIAGLVLHYLIAIAVVEESCKLLAATPAYRSQAFNEPMDGVVYATAASLGFAAVENVLYVLSGGWLVALLRASLSVPGHAFFGATMGYYLGLSKFSRRVRLKIHALLVPVLFHTVYDVIVSVGLGIFGLLLGALFIILLYRRVNRQIEIVQSRSPFKPSLGFCIFCGSILPLNSRYCPTCGGKAPARPEYDTYSEG